MLDYVQMRNAPNVKLFKQSFFALHLFSSRSLRVKVHLDGNVYFHRHAQFADAALMG